MRSAIPIFYVSLILVFMWLSSSFPVGFVQAGIVMIAAAKDYAGAMQYAERAFEILVLTGDERFRPNVLMLAHIGIYSWTRPLRSCLPPLFESYNVGLRYGYVPVKHNK
jgi:hypothetical protein